MLYKSEDALLVHELVEKQSKISPNNTAVKFEKKQLSYDQLNIKANIFAKHILSCGAQQGDVIGLSMTRSLEVIVAMLAILKCGASYLPVDHNTPISTSIKNLDTANVKLVISNGECSELLDNKRTAIYLNDITLMDDLSQSDGIDLTSTCLSENALDDKCYVMFTSGSTGEPKGVVIPHRAVVRLVKNTNYIEIKSTDNIFQFAPLSFDASTFEIWGALCTGATLVLYSGSILDPKLFSREIKDNNVTILWLTAALFHLIASRYISALSPIKTLLAGGDVLSSKLINTVLDAYPEITVINGYGPTENTTFTCCHRMTVLNRPNDVVPIGRAITGTQVYLLDGNLEKVADGEVGELVTSGLGIAIGYLNSKSINFFKEPSIDKGLLYRTGDLVRKNLDEEFEFVGRKDNQIKIRGYRVSLEIIQSSILTLEHVNDAIVLLEEHGVGEQLLTAYLQVGEDTEWTVRGVKSSLSTKLANYMIPDVINFSSNLPISKNGKIDKKAFHNKSIRM
ncbi:amino acid adenylation domain-containing protein [Pseudoalteromonas sp. SCSIO 43210]